MLKVLLVPGGEPSAGLEGVAVVSAVYPYEVCEDCGGELAGLFRVAGFAGPSGEVGAGKQGVSVVWAEDSFVVFD